MLHQLEHLLKGALDAHVDVVRKASQGRGIRTLFALKCIAERGRCYAGTGTTLPAMYDDAGWRTLQVTLTLLPAAYVCLMCLSCMPALHACLMCHRRFC